MEERTQEPLAREEVSTWIIIFRGLRVPNDTTAQGVSLPN